MARKIHDEPASNHSAHMEAFELSKAETLELIIQLTAQLAQTTPHMRTAGGLGEIAIADRGVVIRRMLFTVAK